MKPIAGLNWISIEDDFGKVETALVLVSGYSTAPIEDGALVRFVDGSDWYFELETLGQSIVKISRDSSSFGLFRGQQTRGEFMVKWHGAMVTPAKIRRLEK